MRCTFIQTKYEKKILNKSKSFQTIIYLLRHMVYIYIYIFWYSEMSLSADREEYIIQENDDKKYYITGSDPTGIPIIWEKILGPTVK